jgi:predicted RNA binding protein YcfA (HicA-like mRNA interferase family)
MARLPVVSASELIKVIEHQGFHSIRQKGSHIVVQKRTSQGTVTTVVPNHNELARGTLRSILKKTGLSVEDLVRLLTAVIGIAVQFWPR